jgi:hypothetical protein
VPWDNAEKTPLSAVNALARSMRSSEYVEVRRGIRPAAIRNAALTVFQNSAINGTIA